MKRMLSTVVPVYNSEKYLNQCVDSILSQTWTDFELILVDDGSTDRSAEICDEYTRKDSRVTVIHQHNSGAMNARKSGLETASGDYITFPDADDWMDPDYFERIMRDVQDYQSDIVAAGYTIAKENGEKNKSRNGLPTGIYETGSDMSVNRDVIYLGKFYTAGIIPALWAKCIRKDLFRNHFSFSESVITNGEDAAWTYSLVSRAKSLYVDNEITGYYYRSVPGSLWQRYDPMYLQRIIHLIEYMNTNLKDDRMMSDGLRYFALFMLKEGIDRYMIYEVLKRRKQKERDLQPILDDMLHMIDFTDLDWNGFDNNTGTIVRYITEGNSSRVIREYMRTKQYYRNYLGCIIRKIR